MSDTKDAAAGPSAPESVNAGVLDRCSALRAEPGLLTRLLGEPGTAVLTISRGRVPVLADPWRLDLRAPVAEDHGAPAVFLGRVDQVAIVAVEVDQAHSDWAGVREIGPWLGRAELSCLLTAAAIVAWHRTHPRCSRCGQPTRVILAGWVRHCDHDGSDHYPRTDPAVIMSVIDAQDRLLLARNESWEPGRRSVLAGFVEPGEHPQEAVRREVAEEVGVAVSDVTYLDNQPWPFPGSLMLGYTAVADSSQLRLDEAEIVEAEWYSRPQLASAVGSGRIVLPARMSIARRLIERWYGSVLGSGDEPHPGAGPS